MKAENIIVDRKYGKVLYEIAKTDNIIESIHDELLTLKEVLNEVPELADVLSDDRLEAFEKIEILHELDREFSGTILKFLRTAFEHGRMAEIPEIIDEFELFYYQDKGVLVAEVTSAVPLTETQRVALQEKVRMMTDSGKVILKESVDPNILGGLIVNANHLLIDNSVATVLKEMHKELLS